MEYVCTNEYLVKSHPADHVIRQGELVTLVGYMMGQPMIRLGAHHKSGYVHLDHVTAVIFEAFDDYFKVAVCHTIQLKDEVK